MIYAAEFGLLLLKVGLQPVGNANGYDFTQDIQDILRHDENHEPLSLIPQVNGAVVRWYLREKVSGASAPCFFKPKELQGDKPDESAKVGADHVWSHHVKHHLF